MTIPGRVIWALRCSYAPMPSTSNAPPSGRATSSKRRRCRRAGAEAQGAPPDQILAIERQLGHEVDHRVDRTGGVVTPVEVRYGLHVHPRWHVPDLCDTHVRRHVRYRRSPLLAADGSVSKRRWLSLCRPSGHRAGNRASFPDGRAGELDRAVGRLLLVTRAEVRLENAALRHRLREVCDSYMRMPSETTASVSSPTDELGERTIVHRWRLLSLAKEQRGPRLRMSGSSWNFGGDLHV